MTMMPLPPLNLKNWIAEHRHLLRPPVGNQVVYQDTEFIIMLVGGPNRRTDYHVNCGEEFFYQLEGDIKLVIRDEAGKKKEIPLHQGEIFLLPPLVPHSPQRLPDTVGMVVERRRRPEEKDGFQWYCDQCDHLLYQEYLHVNDIVAQLPPLFARFYENKSHSTCQQCGQPHQQIPLPRTT